MEKSKKERVSGGLHIHIRMWLICIIPNTHKLRLRFAELQSSKRREKTMRTGIDNRLLYNIVSQSVNPVTLMRLRIANT